MTLLSIVSGEREEEEEKGGGRGGMKRRGGEWTATQVDGVSGADPLIIESSPAMPCDSRPLTNHYCFCYIMFLGLTCNLHVVHCHGCPAINSRFISISIQSNDVADSAVNNASPRFRFFTGPRGFFWILIKDSYARSSRILSSIQLWVVIKDSLGFLQEILWKSLKIFSEVMGNASLKEFLFEV